MGRLTLVGAGHQAGSGASFDLGSLPQLSGWYVAGEKSYTTGGVLATNGQIVTELRDKTSGAHHLSNSGSPLYVANAVNGKGAIQFDGTATLAVGASFVYDVHHLFVVVKHTGSDVDIVGSDNLNSGNILLQIDSSRKAKAHIWTSAGAISAIHGTTINDNDVVIIEQYVNATHIGVALNGGTPVETPLSGTKAGTTRNFVLGSRYAGLGSNRYAGKFLEAILTTVTAVGSSDRTNILSYLKSSYGVA